MCRASQVAETHRLGLDSSQGGTGLDAVCVVRRHWDKYLGTGIGTYRYFGTG